MSAVSSGSSQGNAEVREPEGSHQSGSAQSGSAQSGSAQQPADFGANEWLVEELYQRYLADPGSVDRAWWSFFADYTPTLTNGTAPSGYIPNDAAFGYDTFEVVSSRGHARGVNQKSCGHANSLSVG